MAWWKAFYAEEQTVFAWKPYHVYVSYVKIMQNIEIWIMQEDNKRNGHTWAVEAETGPGGASAPRISAKRTRGRDALRRRAFFAADIIEDFRPDYKKLTAIQSLMRLFPR